MSNTIKGNVRCKCGNREFYIVKSVEEPAGKSSFNVYDIFCSKCNEWVTMFNDDTSDHIRLMELLAKAKEW